MHDTRLPKGAGYRRINTQWYEADARPGEQTLKAAALGSARWMQNCPQWPLLPLLHRQMKR